MLISHSKFSSLTLPGFLLALLALVQSASGLGFRPPGFEARQLANSNAQRLARGLPLLKPRKLFGSGTLNAARSAPSGTPKFSVDGTKSTQDGYFGFFDSNGGLLGFYFGSNSITTTPSSATRKRDSGYPTHSFDTPTSSDELFQIYITPQPTTYLAAICYSTAQQLGSGRGSSVEIINVGASTPAGATAYDNLYESTIFSADLTTGEITGHWVNPDGTSPPQYFVFSPEKQGLYLTGDPVAAAAGTVVHDSTNADDSSVALGADSEVVTVYFGTVDDWNQYA